jgi:hypothetical protein
MRSNAAASSDLLKMARRIVDARRIRTQRRGWRRLGPPRSFASPKGVFGANCAEECQDVHMPHSFCIAGNGTLRCVVEGDSSGRSDISTRLRPNALDR